MRKSLGSSNLEDLHLIYRSLDMQFHFKEVSLPRKSVVSVKNCCTETPTTTPTVRATSLGGEKEITTGEAAKIDSFLYCTDCCNCCFDCRIVF